METILLTPPNFREIYQATIDRCDRQIAQIEARIALLSDPKMRDRIEKAVADDQPEWQDSIDHSISEEKSKLISLQEIRANHVALMV